MSIQMQFHREAMERRRRLYQPVVRKTKEDDATSFSRPCLTLSEIIEMEEKNRWRTIRNELARVEKEANRQLRYRTGIYRPTYHDIEARICRALKVEPFEIHQRRRHRDIVFARQAIMYWARRLLPSSLPEIGRMMGGRDHTTVLHGSRVYPAKRASQGRTLKPAR